MKPITAIGVPALAENGGHFPLCAAGRDVWPALLALRNGQTSNTVQEGRSVVCSLIVDRYSSTVCRTSTGKKNRSLAYIIGFGQKEMKDSSCFSWNTSITGSWYGALDSTLNTTVSHVLESQNGKRAFRTAVGHIFDSTTEQRLQLRFGVLSTPPMILTPRVCAFGTSKLLCCIHVYLSL